MPQSLFNKVNMRCGLAMDEIEDRWKKAKQIVKDQYGKTEEDGDEFYQLVTGVFKKMLGKDCQARLGWLDSENTETTAERLLNLVGGK